MLRVSQEASVFGDTTTQDVSDMMLVFLSANDNGIVL